MSAVILLKDATLTLSSHSGDVPILKGISLTVEQGETLAITGPSGSGKSSLLMVLGGLEPLSSGALTLMGQDTSGLTEDALAKLRAGRIGVIFQSFHLIPTMTVFENVKTAIDIARLPNAKEKTLEALEKVGLSHRLDHYPAELSGGEQQRTAIARAYVCKPKLILADEPTGNLDTKNSQSVFELLLKLTDENNTALIMVTHDQNLAQKCGRVITIKDGRAE